MYRYSGGLSNSEFQNFETNNNGADSRSNFWDSTLSFEERVITIVKRLYYSEFSKYLYLGIFLFNLLVLLIGLFNHTSGSIFCILLESIITFTLIFEISIKLFLMKKRFFNSLNNVFDFVVALTCLSLLFLNGDIYRLFISHDNNLKSNQIVSSQNIHYFNLT